MRAPTTLGLPGTRGRVPSPGRFPRDRRPCGEGPHPAFFASSASSPVLFTREEPLVPQASLTSGVKPAPSRQTRERWQGPGRSLHDSSLPADPAGHLWAFVSQLSSPSHRARQAVHAEISG